jgi:hypothetical protein
MYLILKELCEIVPVRNVSERTGVRGQMSGNEACHSRVDGNPLSGVKRGEEPPGLNPTSGIPGREKRPRRDAPPHPPSAPSPPQKARGRRALDGTLSMDSIGVSTRRFNQEVQSGGWRWDSIQGVLRLRPCARLALASAAQDDKRGCLEARGGGRPTNATSQSTRGPSAEGAAWQSPSG